MFNNWWESAKEMYGLGNINGTAKDSSTLYYDPLVDHHFRTNPAGHLNLAFELLGQKNEEARQLFRGAAEFLGWTGPGPVKERTIDFTTLGPTPFATIRGLALAREFGEDAIYAKLKAHAEDNYEPTWHKESGEFTWGFGLNEPYPRGQNNAAIAISEATTSPDAMWRVYNEPNLRKFIEPTVYGVDFPSVCLSQAWYEADGRRLIVATDTGVPAAAGRPTSFRVSNVDPEGCTVTVDGQSSDDWRVVDGDLEITTTVGEHTFIVGLRH